jgi:hypothetical protein
MPAGSRCSPAWSGSRPAAPPAAGGVAVDCPGAHNDYAAERRCCGIADHRPRARRRSGNRAAHGDSPSPQDPVFLSRRNRAGCREPKPSRRSRTNEPPSTLPRSVARRPAHCNWLRAVTGGIRPEMNLAISKAFSSFPRKARSRTAGPQRVLSGPLSGRPCAFSPRA